MVDLAAEMRGERQGERWSEYGTHVGFIPMSELGTMMRQDGGFDKARIREWLQRNPAFVSFDKYLRK
jgi:hypothetical protein